MNICIQGFVQTYVFISLRYAPGSGVAGSCGNSTFNLFRNCQTSEQMFLLLSQQHGRRVLISHLRQHIILRLLDYMHPSEQEMASRGFDLHFFGN